MSSSFACCLESCKDKKKQKKNKLHKKLLTGSEDEHVLRSITHPNLSVVVSGCEAPAVPGETTASDTFLVASERVETLPGLAVPHLEAGTTVSVSSAGRSLAFESVTRGGCKRNQLMNQLQSEGVAAAESIMSAFSLSAISPSHCVCICII